MEEKTIPFKVIIHGVHCDVPHDERTVLCEVEAEDEFTDMYTMVVINEALCSIKRDFNRKAGKKEQEDNIKKFHEFHDYTSNKKKPLLKFKIELAGIFCEVKHPDRKMTISYVNSDYRFKIGDVMCVLYEALCVFRNSLSAEFSREELSDFATKFNIINLGMIKGEVPFVTRGKENIKIKWN